MNKETIEICRSYSRKVNLGNFENIDFFCSAKQEVPEQDFKKASQKLTKLCEQEVEFDIQAYYTAKEEAKRKAVAEKLLGKQVDPTKQWSEKQQEIYEQDSEQDDKKLRE